MRDYDLVIENAAILTMDADGTIIKTGIIGVKDGLISLRLLMPAMRIVNITIR